MVEHQYLFVNRTFMVFYNYFTVVMVISNYCYLQEEVEFNDVFMAYLIIEETGNFSGQYIVCNYVYP